MNWTQRLSQAGYRITAPRRAVMQVLSRSHEPLAPQAIRDQAQALDLELSLVTAYRTLDLLEELELVRQVHLACGDHGYVLASPGHHHAILCECCGDVAEFPGDRDLEALFQRVRTRTGYEVSDHLLQLFGVCPSCQIQHPTQSRRPNGE